MADHSKDPMQWYFGDINKCDTPIHWVRREWKCPLIGCIGTMVYTGEQWPMYPAGYHHRCAVCKYPAATNDGPFPQNVAVEK